MGAFRINIRSDLLDQAIKEGKVNNKLDVSKKSNLSYPTVIELVSGRHGETTYGVLAKYLESLGINPYVLNNMKFSDIFCIRESP
jgi:hypothetical protein